MVYVRETEVDNVTDKEWLLVFEIDKDIVLLFVSEVLRLLLNDVVYDVDAVKLMLTLSVIVSEIELLIDFVTLKLRLTDKDDERLTLTELVKLFVLLVEQERE